MKVESGQQDVDFRETREKALAAQPLRLPLPACTVCGGVLRRLGPTDNFQCALGHQTTARRLYEEGRL